MSNHRFHADPDHRKRDDTLLDHSDRERDHLLSREPPDTTVVDVTGLDGVGFG